MKAYIYGYHWNQPFLADLLGIGLIWLKRHFPLGEGEHKFLHKISECCGLCPQEEHIGLNRRTGARDISLSDFVAKL